MFKTKERITASLALCFFFAVVYIVASAVYCLWCLIIQNECGCKFLLITDNLFQMSVLLPYSKTGVCGTKKTAYQKPETRANTQL